MSHINTRATKWLDEASVEYRAVQTERAGSVEEAAAMRGIPIASLLKTIVVRRESDDYILVLVPGDRSIDWVKLRHHLGVRRISLPDADEAFRITGYERGTITPFGTKPDLPVVADASIAVDGDVSIGGGAHGVSVMMRGSDLLAVTGAASADVTKLAT